MKFIVSGIHTDAGKTLVSAILVAGLNATYWKPIQTGANPTTGEGSDRKFIEDLLSPIHPKTIPETYCFNLPQSPHWAAAAEGKRIEISSLRLPETEGPLVVEGAGGILVPINENALLVDVFSVLKLPVILVSRLYLGAINHTLLSLEALRHRKIPVAGIIFNGVRQPEVEAAILHFGQVPKIGQVPVLDTLSIDKLLEVFHTFNFEETA